MLTKYKYVWLFFKSIHNSHNINTNILTLNISFNKHGLIIQENKTRQSYICTNMPTVKVGWQEVFLYKITTCQKNWQKVNKYEIANNKTFTVHAHLTQYCWFLWVDTIASMQLKSIVSDYTNKAGTNKRKL